MSLNRFSTSIIRSRALPSSSFRSSIRPSPSTVLPSRRAYAESPKGASDTEAAANLANGPTHQGPTEPLKKSNMPVLIIAFGSFLAFVSYPYLRGPAQTKRLLAEKNVELTGTTSVTGDGNDKVLTQGRPQQ